MSINMEGYTEDLLAMRVVEGSAVTPAVGDLYEVDALSPRLSEKDAAAFHSTVARASYMAQRSRPDLLTAAAFLTTRVMEPTEQDDGKLHRMLRYLNGTKEMGIRLKGEPGPIHVTAYADASYGVYADCKSHTGVVILVEHGPVHVSSRSRKQKLAWKSSMEAELIGVSGALSQGVPFRELRWLLMRWD